MSKPQNFDIYELIAILTETNDSITEAIQYLHGESFNDEILTEGDFDIINDCITRCKNCKCWFVNSSDDDLTVIKSIDICDNCNDSIY